MAKHCVTSPAITIIAIMGVNTSGCGSIVDVSDRDAALGTGGTLAYTAAGDAGASTSSALVPPCTLLGSWDTISAPWNGESTASVITFASDGTFTGVPNYSGAYTFDGANLVIRNSVGQDMNCPYEAKWVVQLDCTSALLVPQSDGCTGARRYLDWNVRLVRH